MLKISPTRNGFLSSFGTGMLCMSPRRSSSSQSTELVSLYIGYWTLNNYYYYYQSSRLTVAFVYFGVYCCCMAKRDNPECLDIIYFWCKWSIVIFEHSVETFHYADFDVIIFGGKEVQSVNFHKWFELTWWICIQLCLPTILFKVVNMYSTVSTYECADLSFICTTHAYFDRTSIHVRINI